MSSNDIAPQARRTARGGPWDEAATAFRAWRDGEPGAIDDLVTTMTPVLWQAVRAYGLSAPQAEDVVQTTWLTLVRRWDSVVHPQAVAGWLLTTARREAWHTSKAAAPTVVVPEDVLEWVDDGAGSAEDETVARDEDERLWACVARLPERCRRLLRIVAFEKRPNYSGVAHDLQMPVGSIGPTRGRCLAKLRAALLAEGGAR